MTSRVGRSQRVVASEVVTTVYRNQRHPVLLTLACGHQVVRTKPCATAHCGHCGKRPPHDAAYFRAYRARRRAA